MSKTIFFRLHVGGYWVADGSYNGGSTRCCRIDFDMPCLAMLTEMVSNRGFPENMTKFSYFPSGVKRNKKDVTCDRDVVEMVTHSTEHENMNIYVVRADDPYLDDVLIERDDEEEESESDGEKTNFYEDDYVDDDDSDDDGAQIEFYVGQAFATREKFRETVVKYAVKEKWNIRFERSERKKVAAVCVDQCEWRIYASINSRSENMVKERSISFLCFWYIDRRRVAMLLLLSLAFVVFDLGSYTINKVHRVFHFGVSEPSGLELLSTTKFEGVYCDRKDTQLSTTSGGCLHLFLLEKARSILSCCPSEDSSNSLKSNNSLERLKNVVDYIVV